MPAGGGAGAGGDAGARGGLLRQHVRPLLLRRVLQGRVARHHRDGRAVPVRDPARVGAVRAEAAGAGGGDGEGVLPGLERELPRGGGGRVQADSGERDDGDPGGPPPERQRAAERAVRRAAGQGVLHEPQRVLRGAALLRHPHALRRRRGPRHARTGGAAVPAEGGQLLQTGGDDGLRDAVARPRGVQAHPRRRGRAALRLPVQHRALRPPRPRLARRRPGAGLPPQPSRPVTCDALRAPGRTGGRHACRATLTGAS
mmetsp:Transcript_7861/g.16771  ORF Transcript_7861/g.16771 Transcript_7861/m.16771 type:complete len:257 (-) Transcript_7861:292-1062(-)